MKVRQKGLCDEREVKKMVCVMGERGKNIYVMREI